MSRASYLKSKYGITEEQYQELLDKQNNKCFVCDSNQESFTTRLCVDHNHKTGEIRGLLCNYCNHRLVGRHTNPELFRRMAEYLEKETGWFVPIKKKKRKSRSKKG